MRCYGGLPADKARRRARELRLMDQSVTSENQPETGEGRTIIDIAGIMKMIPHRYPFLLVDRVIDIVRGERGIGIKNVTASESHFAGHFPNHPVMPGVLIIESMAQTAAVLVVDALGTDAEGRVVYFMSIEGAKFRRPVVPGDQLRIECERLQHRGNVWKFRGTARVDGQIVAEASFAAMILRPSPAQQAEA
ncbi:(3R)-hydroxymyristoyl-[acyl carrier protein] dehydratase [Granulibacter bethesdensis]|nr:(3R)-hydroxymyristoyl-[acyl carrier protein] dehydratase [Granulibacter bethesdensis]